jgi:hypothetical protein
MVLSRNILFKRSSAFEVLAKMMTPLVGLSNRWTTPRKTSPGLLYFSLMYALTTSLKGLSPVLSP